MYEVSYTRDGRPVSHLLSRAQATALASYLQRTFRITASIARAA